MSFFTYFLSATILINSLAPAFAMSPSDPDARDQPTEKRIAKKRSRGDSEQDESNVKRVKVIEEANPVTDESKSKQLLLLPEEIADAEAAHFADIFMKLALAVESHYYPQIIRHLKTLSATPGEPF